eukprot:10762983-Ditylum_brightwellii.AAC.1
MGSSGSSGKWLPGKGSAGYLYSQQKDNLYMEKEDQWYQLSLILEQRGQGSSQRFFLNSEVPTSPMEDAIPDICYTNGSTILCTG